MNRYRIYCETDNKWEIVITSSEPTECPVNPTHTIRAGSATIIERNIINEDYKIYDLIDDEIKIKNVQNINYITELTSNIKLHPIHVLTDDGLLQKTEWYNGFIDSSNKGDLILEVEETYTTQLADIGLNPTARTVIERSKSRKWVKCDGTIDSDNPKITLKKYDTSSKSNAIGARRRTNIVDVLSAHTAMGGIFSGVFVDENDANDKLSSIMEEFSTAISTYIKTGRGTLYDLMTNDTNHTWLDTVVVDTAQTQATVPFMIGIDLRTYIIDKLKGLIS